MCQHLLHLANKGPICVGIYYITVKGLEFTSTKGTSFFFFFLFRNEIHSLLRLLGLTMWWWESYSTTNHSCSSSAKQDQTRFFSVILPTFFTFIEMVSNNYLFCKYFTLLKKKQYWKGSQKREREKVWIFMALPQRIYNQLGEWGRQRGSTYGSTFFPGKHEAASQSPSTLTGHVEHVRSSHKLTAEWECGHNSLSLITITGKE